MYDNIERYGSIRPFKSVGEIVQIGFHLGKKLNHDKIYGINEDSMCKAEGVIDDDPSFCFRILYQPKRPKRKKDSC